MPLPPNQQQGQGRLRKRNRGPVVTGSRPQESSKPKPQRQGLTPTQRQRRRNRQPLVPGGITTRGEFIRGRKAAEDTAFRPEENQVNEAANEIPAWYQDYLAKLQGLQTQTAEQYRGLQAQAASLNQPVDALSKEQPVEGGTTKEAVAANNARANLIKAVQGSLQVQQSAQSNKLGQYGAIAGIGKIQKEQEIGKVRKDIAQRRGEFRAKYTVEGKQREFENSLAAREFGLRKNEQTEGKKQRKFENKLAKQQFGLDTAKAVDDAKTRETTYDKEFAKQAAKFGFSPRDWRALGPKGRAERIATSERKSGPESISRIQKKEQIKIAAKHGYNLKQWQALSPQQRGALIRKENKKDEGEGTESDTRTQLQQGKAARGAVQVKNIAQKLKEGTGISGLNKTGHKRSRADAAKAILADPKLPAEPVVVSAVLDAVYDGYLSRATAHRLRNAGINHQKIAEALGIPTYREFVKKMGKSWVNAGPR